MFHRCFCVCRDEVKTLDGKLESAKQRYQNTLNHAQKDSHVMSALPLFEVNDKFLLNQDEAWYTLSIEIQVPIDNIMLQVSSCVLLSFHDLSLYRAMFQWIFKMWIRVLPSLVTLLLMWRYMLLCKV